MVQVTTLKEPVVEFDFAVHSSMSCPMSALAQAATIASPAEALVGAHSRCALSTCTHTPSFWITALSVTPFGDSASVA